MAMKAFMSGLTSTAAAAGAAVAATAGAAVVAVVAAVVAVAVAVVVDPVVVTAASSFLEQPLTRVTAHITIKAALSPMMNLLGGRVFDARGPT
jgi:hypothetical protein